MQARLQEMISMQADDATCCQGKHSEPRQHYRCCMHLHDPIRLGPDLASAGATQMFSIVFLHRSPGRMSMAGHWTSSRRLWKVISALTCPVVSQKILKTSCGLAGRRQAGIVLPCRMQSITFKVWPCLGAALQQADELPAHSKARQPALPDVDCPSVMTCQSSE